MSTTTIARLKRAIAELEASVRAGTAGPTLKPEIEALIQRLDEIRHRL